MTSTKSDLRREGKIAQFESYFPLQQQVGGAGIGFGSTSSHEDPMKELYGDRAEFTKGSNLASECCLTIFTPQNASAKLPIEAIPFFQIM